jgi:hypothetical protein
MLRETLQMMIFKQGGVGGRVAVYTEAAALGVLLDDTNELTIQFGREGLCLGFNLLLLWCWFDTLATYALHCHVV